MRLYVRSIVAKQWSRMIMNGIFFTILTHCRAPFTVRIRDIILFVSIDESDSTVTISI